MLDVKYFKPVNLDEAIALLDQHKQATLWAGGTDLVVKLEHKRVNPRNIIDLKGLQELRYIKEHGAEVSIGALTTIRDLETSDLISEHFPLLAQAAHVLGSWQVRTLATIAGNIVNAAPSAEMAAPILVLGGTVIAEGSSGERSIAGESFFTGPGQTSLKSGEIVKEIRLPKMSAGTKSVYLKHSLRRSMDIALVNSACLLTTDGDKCTEARIGLGAVAPVPMRAEKAEALLVGQVLNEKTIRQAATAAAAECRPIDDIRAKAEYRRELVQSLVTRALTLLWKAGENE